MATAFTTQCSTYIQMKVDYTLTETSSGHSIRAEMFFRRTNSYSGSTYNSMTATITIDGQSATIRDGAMFTIPGNNNNWISAGSTTKTVTHQAAKTITISGSSNAGSYLSGSGNGQVYLPAITVPPSGLKVSVKSKTHNSAVLSVSISSYGTPASASGRYIEGAILKQNSYGANYRYTHSTEGATSQDITVNNSSSGTSSLILTGNTKYWYGGYATNTLSSSSLVAGEIYLPCPPLSNLSATGTQSYVTHNTVRQTFSYTRQSDGGAETRTGQYRYSNNNGQTWSAWTSFGTITNTTGTFNAIIPTDSTVLVQARLSTPKGGASNAISTTVNTLPTHEIVFSNFNYKDINPDTIAITEDDQVFIQRQSIPQIIIPYEDRARITDSSGATLTDYNSIFNSTTITIPYSSTGDTSGNFTKDAVSSSATKSLVVIAKDSLSTTKQVQKSVEVIPWFVPTIDATWTRINQRGNILVQLQGTFAPLTVNDIDKNTVQATYRVDNGEEKPIELTIESGRFSASVQIDEVDFSSIYYVYLKVSDVFADATMEIEVSNIEQGKRLTPTEYNIEVWDWKTNTFRMDISHIIEGGLNIKWTLNDIEDLSFNIDLAKFEKQCSILGVDSREMLEPYVHDIRVRRNKQFIVGCQIVEANISVSGNNDPQLQIRATGYLNLFKDRYINMPWSGYSYSQIARMLVQYGQKADCLIKNPTIDIDTSYWLPVVGAIARVTSSPTPHRGSGCLKVTNSTAGGHLTIGSQMNVPAGTPIKIDFWFHNSAAITVYERQFITQTTGQRTIGTYSTSAGANWTHWTLNTYTTAFENGYIVIDSTNGGNAGYYMAIDDFNVYRIDDEDSLQDFKVILGTDTATATQNKTRERNYELQNIKDAIMDLTNLEDDNFDFEFTYDRKFNIFKQKGSEKRELALEYPGNVSGLEITRSASELANKIQNIGSGIGDERYEVWASNRASREKYGTRESIVTNNNVSLTDTLSAQAEGLLKEQKDVAKTLSVTIEDGSINPTNLQTGDIIPFKLGPQLIPYGYVIIKELEGWYRVKAISLSVSQDSVENMKLTLELYEKF